MPETRKPMPKPPRSFDVTAVIGTVRLDQEGEHSPHVAAFMLIAEHDAPGAYTFPTPNGGECRVEVSFTDPETTA